MGDGRYYTYQHFFFTFVLVMLSAFACASMIICYFKNHNKSGQKHHLLCFFIINAIIVINLVEVVIHKIDSAIFLKQSSMYLLLVFFIYLFTYLFTYKIPIISINLLKETKALYFGLFIALMIFILISLNYAMYLVDQYDFNSFTYSNIYIFITIIFLIFILFCAIYIYSSDENFHELYSNKYLSLFLLIFLGTPLTMHLSVVVLNKSYISYSEYFLYFIMVIILNVSASTDPNFGLTTSAFEKIGDVLKDIVVVIDENMNIIYRNGSAKSSDIIKDVESFNPDNKGDLFKGEIIEKTDINNNIFIEVSHEKKQYYYTYKITPVRDSHEVIAYIITLSDITSLVELLSYLEEKQDKEEKLNSQLRNYAKVVYQLEKEKAINSLLEDIVKTQEISMEILINKIEDIESNIESKDFEKLVNDALLFNLNILEDVRKAVTLYREHYRG